MEEEKNPKPKRQQKKVKNYLKYSGFAVQFFVLILVAALLGKRLDAYFELERPLITIFLILFFSSGYFYRIYLDLFK